MVVFDVLDATDASTHGDADCMPVILADFEPGISYCIHAGGNTVVDKWIHFPNVFLLEVLSCIEILDGAANARRQRAGIKIVDESDAGVAFTHVRPGVIQPVANR